MSKRKKNQNEPTQQNAPDYGYGEFGEQTYAQTYPQAEQSYAQPGEQPYAQSYPQAEQSYAQPGEQPYAQSYPQPAAQPEAQKPKIKYLPRSFLWNVIGVCLSFFFGIFVCLGAIVGAVAIAGKKASVKQISSFAGIDETKFVSEAYLDKTVLDLASDLLDDAKNNKLNNLNAVGKYTPLAGTAFDKVSEQLAAMGVKLNKEEFMNVEFSALGTYLSDNVVQNIVLGDVLKLTPESSALMLALCYGTKDEDYTVTDGKIVMNEGKHATTISDLTKDSEGLLGRIGIGTALNVTASSEPALIYLAYGSEGEDYHIVDGKIVMNEGKQERKLSDLTAADANIVNNAKIRDLVAIDDKTGDFLKAVADWKIGDLTDGYRINRLKVGQIVSIGENASKFMKTIKDWRIEEFNDEAKFNALALGDIVTIDEGSPAVLQSVADTGLSELGRKINTLPLTSILGESAVNNNALLKNIKYSTLETLADDVAKVSAEDVFGDDMYQYLSVEASGGTFADLYTAYESTGKNDKAASALRPEPITDKSAVTKKFLLKGSTTELTEGFFTDGNLVTDQSTVYRKGSEYAVTVKTPVVPVYEWKRVDYAAKALVPLGEDETIAENGSAYEYTVGGTTYPVEQDGNGFYAVVNERVDFERAVTQYTLGADTYRCTDGKITVNGTAYTVFSDESGSYIEQSKTAVKGYREANGAVHTEAETEVAYFLGNERLDRYLTGVWYLLFPSGNVSVAVTELADSVSAVQSELANAPLWKLYFLGLIDQNPFKDLGSENLNDFTLNKLIQYVTNPTVS